TCALPIQGRSGQLPVGSHFSRGRRLAGPIAPEGAGGLLSRRERPRLLAGGNCRGGVPGSSCESDPDGFPGLRPVAHRSLGECVDLLLLDVRNLHAGESRGGEEKSHQRGFSLPAERPSFAVRRTKKSAQAVLLREVLPSRMRPAGADPQNLLSLL